MTNLDNSLDAPDIHVQRNLGDDIDRFGVMQSLTDTVDLEDLGMHSLDKVMREHKDISLDKENVFPTWLRNYTKVSASCTCKCISLLLWQSRT